MKFVLEEKKDDVYWERRRKNNEVVKWLWDVWCYKEEEIVMRVVFLE